MIRRRTTSWRNSFALVVGILLLLGVVGAQAQDVSIKILVNDDPISDYDISQRSRFMQLTAKAQPGPELDRQSTEMLITEHLQIQEGRKLGITPSEAEINRVLDGMAAQNNLDVNGLATALKSSGVSIRTLKNRIGAQMVWQRVAQQKFRREVSVNDAQIDEAMALSGGGSSSGGIKQLRLPLASGANQSPFRNLTLRKPLRPLLISAILRAAPEQSVAISRHRGRSCAMLNAIAPLPVPRSTIRSDSETGILSRAH